jgi:hypothetical protein
MNSHSHLMSRLQFIQFVTVTGWLWFGSGNTDRSTQLAVANEPAPSCQVVTFRGGELTPNTLPPTRLLGTLDLAIVCQGHATGTLSLTLESISVYNGSGSMRFVNSSGLLAGANPNPTADTLTIPINSQGDGRGNGRLLVEIVAQPQRLLQAGNNYQLKVSAAVSVIGADRR